MVRAHRAGPSEFASFLASCICLVNPREGQPLIKENIDRRAFGFLDPPERTDSPLNAPIAPERIEKVEKNLTSSVLEGVIRDRQCIREAI